MKSTPLFYKGSDLKATPHINPGLQDELLLQTAGQVDDWVSKLLHQACQGEVWTTHGFPDTETAVDHDQGCSDEGPHQAKKG